MALGWYEKKKARLNLARALIKDGWKCHTYRPASGTWPNQVEEAWPFHVAEKSGFLLVVDMSRGGGIQNGDIEFEGNPKGKLWHIERGGKILRYGRNIGWNDLYFDRCLKMINRWNAIISVQPRWTDDPEASTADGGPPEGATHYSHGGPVDGVDGPITWELWINKKGNVEVRFSDRPTPEVKNRSVKYVRLRWHRDTQLWWGANVTSSWRGRWSTLGNILAQLTAEYAKKHGTPEAKPEPKPVEIVAPQPEPVPVEDQAVMRKIIFEDSESNIFKVRPWKFSRWHDAELFLNFIAEMGPPAMGCEKTWFQVTYNDGETYDGRYDVQREILESVHSLNRQLKDFIAYNAGIKCPPHERLNVDTMEEALTRWLGLLDSRFGKEHRLHWARLNATWNLDPNTYDDHFRTVTVSGLPFIYESGTKTWYHAHESGNYTYEITRPVIAYDVTESPGWLATIKGTVLENGELLASGRRQREWYADRPEDREVPFYTMYEVARELNWVDNIVVPRASEKRTVEIVKEENEPMKRVVTTPTSQGEVVTVSDATTGQLLVQAPKKAVKQFALW